jgi:hypothetical protein
VAAALGAGERDCKRGATYRGCITVSGTGFFVRRMAGLIAVVVSVGVIAAPAAWASGDTVTAAANVQFNGVVDSGPQCSTATAISINWGDGSTSAGRYESDGQVVGTHKYTAAGSFSGSITFTGASPCTRTPDTFTATVGSTPQFTECPQVGVDLGCQFLIDITAGGTSVLQDTTQGPYENSEDALIGVKNDSSSPVASIPISVPPSSGEPPFGFDGDGLCDNGAGPVPADCQQLVLNSGALAPAGTPCDPSAGSCATPQPAGQPGPDGDSYPLTNRNGYEGPGIFYTNVSADTSSGTVNFVPALQPGQSTYFSLEEPPSANAINVGATPVGVGLSAAPSVTATSAAFVGIVDPNGSATTAQFQFNLDPKYGKLASVTQSTTSQSVGGDFANHVVTATVTGLDPNAIYHVRLVATNKNGSTTGTDVVFKTTAAPPPGPPTLGRTFNLAPVHGIVLIKVNGLFVPLTQLRQFPKNTEIDALGGTLKIITALPGHAASDAAAKKGKGKGKKGKVKTQSGTFGGAIFKISQAHSGLATLAIVEGAFKGAPSYASCRAKRKAADASTAAASSKTLQLLHSSATGKFATRGKYAAATVRGTKWTIADRCDGTLTHDLTDSVAVTDFVHHKTVILHAGQTYLAKKP